MAIINLYYATNRKHIGRDRWRPSSYGNNFSNDGMENLRFGIVQIQTDDNKVRRFLNTPIDNMGAGDGLSLSSYLTKCAKTAKIHAYEENLSHDISEESQDNVTLGSRSMFDHLQSDMGAGCDVLVYIHGFNVSWYEAVGSAVALQLMQAQTGEIGKKVVVVLFTWPSDGLALPWVSYKSDRSEAKGSGAAVGRAILKLRDFLMDLRDRARKGNQQLCGQEIHLLCHSMGCYLLTQVLDRLSDFTPGSALPKLFHSLILCAPDVDDDALESGNALGDVHQIASEVTVYYNRGDVAMVISDYTKGQPERLGGNGAAHPGFLHNKVHQIDCTSVVHGPVEHSYYFIGNIAADIRSSMDGIPQNSNTRKRRRVGIYDNVWEIVP